MEIDHKIDSFDANDDFEEIRDGLSYLTGESNVSLHQILTDKFIIENTDFDTLINFFKAAGINNEQDLNNPDFDAFVKKHTRFNNWQQMLIESSNQYALQHFND